MKYAIVLNGCDENYISRAEEINGFIQENLDDGWTGITIIFYQDKKLREKLISNAPTSSVILLKTEYYQPEVILSSLTEIDLLKGFKLFLFPGNYSGNELCARFAYRMNGSSLISVNGI